MIEICRQIGINRDSLRHINGQVDRQIVGFIYINEHINKKQNRQMISYKYMDYMQIIEKIYIHEKMPQYVPN